MFLSASSSPKLHHSTSDGYLTHDLPSTPSYSRILSLSICNDNTYVALLRANDKPQIFSIKDPSSIRLVHTINVSDISTLTFKHNTKKHIAMGTSTGDVVIYDTKTRSVANIHPKITEFCTKLDFSCDDQQLCGYDANIFFLFPEIESSGHVKRYRQKGDCCYLKCHHFIPNRVVLGLKNGNVSVWDLAEGIELVNLELFQTPISGVVMSSCGNYLIASSEEIIIAGLDLFNSGAKFQHKLEPEQVTSIDLSSDDKYLAVGHQDGTIKLLQVKEQFKPFQTIKAHEAPVNWLVFDKKPMELNTNFSSVIKLVEEGGVKDQESVVMSRFSIPKCPSLRSRVEYRDDSLAKFKRGLVKVLRTEMDALEGQLMEHCVKYQAFLDKEFDQVDQMIRRRWDIFTGGDMNQIVKAICNDESKSTM